MFCYRTPHHRAETIVGAAGTVSRIASILHRVDSSQTGRSDGVLLLRSGSGIERLRRREDWNGRGEVFEVERAEGTAGADDEE